MNQLSLFDPIEIQLTQGKIALIDPCDADLLNLKWCYQRGCGNRDIGYAMRSDYSSDKRLNVYVHRVIMERILGRTLSPKEQVDHADGNQLNDQRSNLRLATAIENGRNRRKKYNNASGYKGVYFDRKKWRAKIKAGPKATYLGYFDTPEDAYAAYCKAAIELHGEFARLA